MKQFNQPEIFYEESHEGLTNGMPFMRIEKDNNIPGAIFIGAALNFENKNKEVESEEEMCEIVMQMYINSETLKSKLSEEDYNKVRVAIGLKPLGEILEN